MARRGVHFSMRDSDQPLSGVGCQLERKVSELRAPYELRALGKGRHDVGMHSGFRHVGGAKR
jgi:hypothetical protein